MKTVTSKFAAHVDVIDPDTKNTVCVEIRKLASGELIGLDQAYLDQLADDEIGCRNPYTADEVIEIPSDERRTC